MGVCVPDKLQRIICERLRKGGFRVIGICILLEGKKEYALKFDPTSMSGVELMRVPFDKVVFAIWECDTMPHMHTARDVIYS
jgi:nucleoside-diphosphate-sugar epimerase